MHILKFLYINLKEDPKLFAKNYFFGQKFFRVGVFYGFVSTFTKNSSALVKNFTDKDYPEMDAVFITLKIKVIEYQERSQGGVKLKNS